MYVDSEEERPCPAFETLLVTQKIYIPDCKISLDFFRCSDILIHSRLDPLLGCSPPPLDLLSQTDQVCGWIYFFKISYFVCSDLQLFAIFMAEKLVGPRWVQIVSLRKQKSPIEIGVYMYYLEGSL